MDRPIYLDYSASAPLKPAARAAIAAALEGVGNASSVHGFGRRQRALLESARLSVAGAVNAMAGQVVFTGGATEANNMALAGFPGRALLVSGIEHPSILQAAPQAVHISVEASGLINLNELEDKLKAISAPALVAVMLVNNETGVIQPMAAVVEIARRYGALVHCDAVQALGRIPLDMAALGVDSLSLSAHKAGGPQGVGALVLRPKLAVEPFLRGGGQEMRRRAGTENVAGAAGFAGALENLESELAKSGEWAGWRDAFEAFILREAPEAVVFGKNAPRVAGISCVAMPGVKNETQLMAFDLAGYAVSAGSACSSGKLQASHVLKAMGADDALATSAIRMSFGWASLSQELTGFAQCWASFYARQQKRKVA